MINMVIAGDLGLYGERLAVVLGFITLASFAATGLSCRSFVSLTGRLGLGRLTESRAYQLFYRYHSYYWWIFFLVLAMHLMTGLMHTELPLPGDPDAPIHWAILIMAVSVLVATGFVFSSCRTFVSLFDLIKGSKPLGRGYRSFYRIHGYLWVVLLLTLIGHLVAGYIHIGFWPTVIG